MQEHIHEWQGYNFDDLRVKRILSLTRIELEKSRLMSAVGQYTNHDKTITRFPMLSKVAGALDYIDYASLAFTFGRRIFKIFRRKKR